MGPPPDPPRHGDRDLWLVREPPGGLRQLKRLKDLLGLPLGLTELRALGGHLPVRLVEGVDRAATEARLAEEAGLAAVVDYAPRGQRPGEGPESLESFLADLAVGRGDLRARLERLVAADPSVLPRVLEQALDDPELAPPFLEDFLADPLGPEDWPPLVARALEVVADEDEGGGGGLAEALLESCVRYRVEALHPHLERLFELQLDGLGEAYFRGAGEAALALFEAVLAEEPRDPERLRRAWCGLLETRHLPCWEEARRQAGAVALPAPPEVYFHEVGMEVAEGTLRRLDPPGEYHLEFPAGFLATPLDPVPSTRGGDPPRLRFGGSGGGVCAGCGGPRHHMVTLDPVPEGCGVAARRRLVLEACLACLGWEEDVLAYRHDARGEPNEQLPAPVAARVPKFPTQGLEETRVALVPTPAAWRWQDWGASGRRENLHRVGGAPTWIQGARYPRCPTCEGTMGFLLQLDSRLPAVSGRPWLWGSGGIAYGFWCDPCANSGWLWQCT